MSSLSQQGFYELVGEMACFSRRVDTCAWIFSKRGKFRPNYLGQLSGYLTVYDMTDKKPHENPSIGIVLCQDANRQFVEIMVRDYDKPMGVATYRTAQEMPENLRKTLPDIDKLQNLLSENDSKSETVRWFIYVRKISGSWMEYKNPCNNHVNYCRDFDLFRPTYSMFLSKSFYEFNIFLTSVNLAL